MLGLGDVRLGSRRDLMNSFVRPSNAARSYFTKRHQIHARLTDREQAASYSPQFEHTFLAGQYAREELTRSLSWGAQSTIFSDDSNYQNYLNYRINPGQKLSSFANLLLPTSEDEPDPFDTDDPLGEDAPAPFGPWGGVAPDVTQISSLLESSFNDGLLSYLGEFASSFNLQQDLPLMNSALADLIGLESALNAALGSIQLTNISDMSDIVDQLVAQGFEMEFALSQSDLDNLTDSEYTNFFRMRQAYQVPIANQQTSLNSDALGDFSELGSLGISGDMTLVSDLQFDLIIGMDAHGFYLDAQPLIEAEFEAVGNFTASNAINGEASLVLTGQLGAESPHGYSRIRLDDLAGDLNQVLVTNFDGAAGVELDVSTQIVSESVEFGGRWLWDIESGGFQSIPEVSGFDTGRLLDSITRLVGTGIQNVSGHVSDFVGFADGIPLIGTEIVSPLQALLEGDLSYSDDLDADEYFEDSGFRLVTLVSPEDIFAYVVDGVALPSDLLTLRYVGQSTESLTDVNASGSESFGVGAASLDVQLDGQINGSLELETDFTFGFDSLGGIFFQEYSPSGNGSGFFVAEVIGSGALNGNADLAGLADVTIASTGSYNVNARFNVDDGDGMLGERLYVFDGGLSDVFANPNASSLGGELTLNTFSLVATFSVFDAFLPDLALSLTGTASVNLTTGETTANFEQSSLNDSLADVLIAGANFFGEQAAALAFIIEDVPLFGENIRGELGTNIEQMLTFDPGEQSSVAYLQDQGFIELQSIDVESIISGDFVNQENLQISLQTLDQFAGRVYGANRQRSLGFGGSECNVCARWRSECNSKH